ncbi:MAG: CpsD/CapB family tyrosine-protein kinase [Dehalococcoidia bacterium]|nr:CpsD/CapB family tyrosine-protein kinase [Dehalococcoidia bacterium]
MTDLAEAIREIQLMAGLGEHLAVPVASARLLTQPCGSPAAVAGLRGFKGIRGSLAVTLPAPIVQLPLAAAPRSLAIGVTSPDYGDGKTTMAIALASSLAHDFGAQVMLVDADFHTHSVGREYGLEGRRGLSDAIAGASTLAAVTYRHRRASLSVVTAGNAAGDPARMARSERLAPLVETMKATSGFVVLDLPATLHSMNAPVLARRCDGVIVVVRAGHTSQRDLERSLHLLRDANVLGVVINRQRSRVPRWMERLLAMPQ